MRSAPLAARLCTGACIGFCAPELDWFRPCFAVGLTTTTLVVTALLLATPALLLRNPGIALKLTRISRQQPKRFSRATTRPDRWAFIYFLFYAVVAVRHVLVFARAMFEKPDGIYTGVLTITATCLFTSA